MKGEGREGTREEEHGRGKSTERPARSCMTSLPGGSEGWGLASLRPRRRNGAELWGGGGARASADSGTATLISSVRGPQLSPSKSVPGSKLKRPSF